MKKIIILVLIFLNFQTNLKAEIAYIDINFILNTSEVGKLLNKHIQKINNQKIPIYQKKETELIDKEKLLIAQQNIMEKSEFEKKFNNLSKEVQKYRSDKKKHVEEINQIKIKNTKKILQLLNPIITKYVESNSISLVIPKKNIIVGKKNLDITDEIITILNSQVKSLEF
jgi:Outer membrane protein